MLSRRHFLQAAGIALAVAHLPRLTQAAPRFEPLYGRALATIPVYAAPQTTAPLITNLWSDTVTPLLDTSGVWYRLPDGYAQRALLQPLLAPAHNAGGEHDAPYWGEVTGAVAIVRAWCAADAPVVTRVGHGGVLYLRDMLMPNGVRWYGVAGTENGELLGWSQAASWSPAAIDAIAPSLTLSINRQTQQMQVLDGAQALLSAPVTINPTLIAGTYAVNGRNFTAAPVGEHYGVPWALSFGADQHLSGAYWHNRFGTASAGGAAVEVAPALARWLYPRSASVIIS